MDKMHPYTLFHRNVNPVIGCILSIIIPTTLVCFILILPYLLTFAICFGQSVLTRASLCNFQVPRSTVGTPPKGHQSHLCLHDYREFREIVTSQKHG